MLAALKDFISEQFSAESTDEVDSRHELELAAAALAMDIARADDHFDEAERQHIATTLASRYDLAAAETEQLLGRANDQLEKSVSLYDFTRQLNDGLEHDEKISIVRLLWDVAWADSEIDKYEEYFIRKIADLLYVSHADYIRAKLAAEQDQTSSP